jgi:hypothetical protein
MDGNQIVNVMDIMALLGDFGLCDPRLISDGTNDGCVGIQDLLLLLVEFGTDCTDICIRGRDAEDATMRGPWVELAPDVQGDADIPSAWWSDHCDAGPDVPPDDFVILVKMGEVRDYFTVSPRRKARQRRVSWNLLSTPTMGLFVCVGGERPGPLQRLDVEHQTRLERSPRRPLGCSRLQQLSRRQC